MRGGLEFWSNLAYLASAVALIPSAPEMSVVLVALGACSAWYHRTGTRTARLADRGMALGAALSALGVLAGLGWAGVVLGTAFGLAASFKLRRVDYLIAGVAVCVLVVVWPRSILPVSLVALATLSAWLAEPYLHSRTHASRYDLLHGLWHVLTAFAFYLLFR